MIIPREKNVVFNVTKICKVIFKNCPKRFCQNNINLVKIKTTCFNKLMRSFYITFVPYLYSTETQFEVERCIYFLFQYKVSFSFDYKILCSYINKYFLNDTDGILLIDKSIFYIVFNKIRQGPMHFVYK